MSTEVVNPRLEYEARWCYERRLERLTMRDIADLTGRPVSEGGLGYALSTPTVHRRVKHYYREAIELEGESRDEARSRELEILDRTTRYVVDLTDPIDRAATAKATAVASWMLDNDPDYRGPRPGDPRLVVLADPAIRLRALAEVRAQSESRRKLLGTDAPTETKIDVTVTDAATAELNAMLAEAGLPPIETEAPA